MADNPRPEDNRAPSPTAACCSGAAPSASRKPTDFEVADAPLPAPGEGEVLCRTIYLSLDPYMRGRMSDRKSYTASVEIGDADGRRHRERGGASRSIRRFQAGDFVLGYGGWQSYHVALGSASAGPFGRSSSTRSRAPISTALGVLGMPGMTAYVGLLDIGQPKAGETVVVSAAAGAVGSAVGQMAKIKGCRAVGVAGGRSPSASYVVKELGFDACVELQAPGSLRGAQGRLPEGHRRLLRQRRRRRARTRCYGWSTRSRASRICGLVSQYNATDLPARAEPGRRSSSTGSRSAASSCPITSTAARPSWPSAGGWLREGQLKYREDVVEGHRQRPARLHRSAARREPRQAAGAGRPRPHARK